MIEQARRKGSAESSEATIDFIVADCTKPTSYAGGPFDLVFGACLLNYAADHAGLVDMFHSIALNFKDGGHFVSVTLVPAQSPVAAVEAEFQARPPPEGSGGGLVYYFTNNVQDGIYFHTHGDNEVGAVDFDRCYLSKEVYEAAAREAGLTGELTWALTSVPERYLRGEAPGGSSMEGIETYLKVPNYGLLVLAK